MSAAENAALMDRYWEAFSTQNIPDAVACFHDDITYEDLAIQQIHAGKEGVRAFWELYFAAAGEGFNAERTSMVVDDSGYCFEWTVTGVINGSFGIFQGDGQAFEIRGVSVGVIEDGLVRHNRDYWNLAAVMAQMGVTTIPALDQAPTS